MVCEWSFPPPDEQRLDSLVAMIVRMHWMPLLVDIDETKAFDTYIMQSRVDSHSEARFKASFIVLVNMLRSNSALELFAE